MQRLRAKTLAVRLLVALFWAAQFAGVIALPPAQAHTATGATVAHTDHHHAAAHAGNDRLGKDHAGGHRHDGCAHPETCPDNADHCCALHAFFVGVLPPASALDNIVPNGETLRPAVTHAVLGHQPNLLDRPPRPQS